MRSLSYPNSYFPPIPKTAIRLWEARSYRAPCRYAVCSFRSVCRAAIQQRSRKQAHSPTVGITWLGMPLCFLSFLCSRGTIFRRVSLASVGLRTSIECFEDECKKPYEEPQLRTWKPRRVRSVTLAYKKRYKKLRMDILTSFWLIYRTTLPLDSIIFKLLVRSKIVRVISCQIGCQEWLYRRLGRGSEELKA